MTFLTKLAAASRARDSVICVGLDPEPDRIPEHLGRGAQAAIRFLRKIVNATSDHVCCYKPNMAFYERYGSAGLDILALTLQPIPAQIPVILDARPGVGAQGGDIASALRAAVDANGGGVLPSASRSILFAGSGDDFDAAAGRAAEALKRQANDARAARPGIAR